MKGTTTAKLVQSDNGYFEIWEKPNGERVRVNTEDMQYAFASRRDARAKFHQSVVERFERESDES